MIIKWLKMKRLELDKIIHLYFRLPVRAGKPDFTLRRGLSCSKGHAN